PDDVARPGDPAHPGAGSASGTAGPSGTTAVGGSPEPRGLDLPWADGTFPPDTVAGRRQVWDALMGLALHEATHALASDDVPVGALVVGPDGRLLGVGRNRR